ncbi:acetyl- carboxylase subunit alpha : Acetyl-coenzyme A carboxylase carboxyl transferase subunit alpha OS=Singulisphaera acidiphila (strain ATCC BAA-1392 / DSM 18658 / VKM B-2454 / MOB10) GN=accA PE=3 SV=1: ACCA [Gemmata massiliana]|uniref:Acetyl-coenzyme A carboxylase carboxyl transferase subunit alpha n=1 Tax=Gemmata massiliana TaxID=1210884 RepID=A0A6P2D3F2_9BACT|nr:acetyl-CoA carboxylase carboxyltransferase subunit alpha [Gemmata massiliana]VTR94955.1 acetyl- carboxylase subunit alpha : Acetyl-coenzyme A carboxylase carboxyl transferase subunit alpha OS=Singulisphaera acidiphila (strain ATCC BAA-1392 / DSM 18658 / VKM B-2454 / MOB10) GN=accA PE=3 SV=1: ACCA [Gemmata massiliana]
MVSEPLPFEQDIHELEVELAHLETTPDAEGTGETIKKVRRDLVALKKQKYSNLTAWETILVSRHRDRPQFLDYVDMVFEEFVELHGDRAIGDDRAIRAGFARLDGQKIMLVGHQKGKTLAERQQCYYGCAHPEGYRKALSKMHLAAKYRIPIVCLIDTPGAFPGIGAEERGQSQLIATSILEMTKLATPIVCVVIGEGGSGGALGIGVGDSIGMLQHAYYSVISPEGCAGILWKVATDESKPRAADALKLTATDLKRFGVIDTIVSEPLGGAHRDPRGMGASLKTHLSRELRGLVSQTDEALLDGRYSKFRRMGFLA